MASESTELEIIDLTAPDVIELDSDGEVVEETPGPSQSNGTTQTMQTKKKRKKRKKKPSSTNVSAQDAAEDVGSTSAEASRAQSPTVHVEGLVDGAASSSAVGGKKRPLVDRLEDAPYESRRDGEEQTNRKQQQQQGGERRLDKERAERRERDRYRDRERDRGGDRGGDLRKDRERRRSRSPRREREQERDRDGDRPRRRSRSRERERERERRKRKREKEKAPESDAQLFFEDVTPTEVPGTGRPSEPVAGPSNLATSGSDVHSQSDNGLLLPAHVSLTENGEDADGGPLKVPTPEGSDDDEDYIDYLDYDDDRRVSPH